MSTCRKKEESKEGVKIKQLQPTQETEKGKEELMSWRGGGDNDFVRLPTLHMQRSEIIKYTIYAAGPL